MCSRLGLVQSRNCRSAIHQCVRSIAPQYAMRSSASMCAVVEKLRDTDLRETCRYVYVLETYIDKLIKI